MTNTLIRPDGTRLVYDRLKVQEGISAPGLVFLCGFGSDKEGSKALFLEEHAKKTGQSFVRFDYFGHGQSGGDFKDGTIGRWAEDAVAVLDELTQGPQILIGSSMGGWLMLLAALARKDRVAGLIGIAAAPDFTRRLQWPKLTAAQQATVMEAGLVQVPSNYEDDYVFTRALFEDGDRHLLLDGSIDLDIPVTLLHGQQDADVPVESSLEIAAQVRSEDVVLELVKSADHRFSGPDELARLAAAVDTMTAKLR
ncbi:MAG: alpha/beta hydrolase [Alphaproteobacteria bacterium TMED89]|nr:alpha/beta hydrolase [Rhodospirillaceae bacterium]RPH12625.1 MAG: alpha/beta hydrolase [Alphaproteobacteria bacterium TMED89]